MYATLLGLGAQRVKALQKAIYPDRGKLDFRTPERWQSGRMRRFAKPLYWLIPVPRVRIPPSPPDSLGRREVGLHYYKIR